MYFATITILKAKINSISFINRLSANSKNPTKITA